MIVSLNIKYISLVLEFLDYVKDALDVRDREFNRLIPDSRPEHTN